MAKVIIGERIRRGLSQAALAQQLGVTQQQVSKLENGDFDNLATLRFPPSAYIGRTAHASPRMRCRVQMQ